jgi:hypothetical protein
MFGHQPQHAVQQEHQETHSNAGAALLSLLRQGQAAGPPQPHQQRDPPGGPDWSGVTSRAQHCEPRGDHDQQQPPSNLLQLLADAQRGRSTSVTLAQAGVAPPGFAARAAGPPGHPSQAPGQDATPDRPLQRGPPPGFTAPSPHPHAMLDGEQRQQQQQQQQQAQPSLFGFDWTSPAPIAQSSVRQQDSLAALFSLPPLLEGLGFVPSHTAGTTRTPAPMIDQQGGPSVMQQQQRQQDVHNGGGVDMLGTHHRPLEMQALDRHLAHQQLEQWQLVQLLAQQQAEQQQQQAQHKP